MFEAKSEPLTRAEARHLLCRACFSTSPAAIDAATGRNAAELVAEWMAEPRDSWFLINPSWMSTMYPPSGSSNDQVRAFLNSNAYYVAEVRAAWMRELLSGGFRNRMALFWHNHFVTDVRKYRYAPLAFGYVRLMQSHAFGDFRRFVKAITTEGSMLYYLDGRYSTRAAPNENYARELMELFTMGPTDESGNPNYSQADIRDAARALTGWRMNVRSQWNSTHSRSLFDSGRKTFLGLAGEFDAEDVVDVIFGERTNQVARFISRAVMRELVHHEPEADAVVALAERFIASGFQIGELLLELLGSSYFFRERFRGTRIKDPIEMMALQFSLSEDAPTVSTAENVVTFVDNLGQSLLAPPNVAGWPGHRAWLNTDLLPRRWSGTDWAAGIAVSQARWQGLVTELCGTSSHQAVEFPLKLAELLFPVPLDHVSVPDIAEPFGGDLVSAPLPEEFLTGPEHRVNLVKLFLSGVPWYEWNPSSPAGVIRIMNYVRELARLPEFQLS